jgi:DNA mismatch endonuclease, patch repair protein
LILVQNKVEKYQLQTDNVLAMKKEKRIDIGVGSDSNQSIRTKIMKAVKSKGSKIEVRLMKELWRRGVRYRKNVKGIVGTPDIVFRTKKVAVFCDSEFWHGKDWENRKNDFKTNKEFWFKKIERNIEKDKEVNVALKEQGWVVLRFWGKQINKSLDECCESIIKTLDSR